MVQLARQFLTLVGAVVVVIVLLGLLNEASKQQRRTNEQLEATGPTSRPIQQSFGGTEPVEPRPAADVDRRFDEAIGEVRKRTAAQRTEVPLEPTGGIYTVPVRINGVITLQFIVDSGAAEVQIPADVALTLLRAKTIEDSDFLPGGAYTLADGSTLKSLRFTIRELQIGDRQLSNVPAALAPPTGALLLGQSVLARLPSWSLDNRRHVLVIDGGEDSPTVSALKLAAPNRGGMPQSGVQSDTHRQETAPDKETVLLPSSLPLADSLGPTFAATVPAALISLRAMIETSMHPERPDWDAQLSGYVEDIRGLPLPERRRSDAARQLNEDGLNAFRRDDFSTAISRFYEGVRADPEDVELVNNLGYTYLYQGQLNQAEPLLVMALLLAPTRSIAWDNLGQTFALHGNQPAAVACMLNAYHFSRNRAVTRAFFDRQAQTNPHEEVRSAAREVLASPVVSE
jgi:hypothetical protein